MKNQSIMWKIFLLLSVGFVPLLLAQGGKEYGQFAPADAYTEDSVYAYYGSENEWSRRMFSERAADRFYKRRGQRQMLAILDGHPEVAAQLCRARLAADATDLEAQFTLTIALTRLGDLDAALSSMKRAVALGLPFERFLAGPRELLRPLTATTAFREYAAAHPRPLLHGPLLGQLTGHSAQIWVRTLAEVPVTVQVFEAGRPVPTAKSDTVLSRADRDYTAVVSVSGLMPATTYAYQVFVDGQAIFREDFPQFQTYPAAGAAAKFTVAFGGCAGYTPDHERIWDTIALHRPLAMLLLGDNVYIDLPEMPGAFHNYTYYRRQSRPEFRRMVQSCAVYAIWDDHDSAIDDIWMGPYPDRPAWKQPLLAHFRQNWNNPPTVNPQWPGCWFRFSIGDVDFFMLDGRTYRTNPFKENPSMLGPVQKAWLLRELAASTATFKLIVSPVSWAPGAKPDSRDTWNGFLKERQEIFDFLRDQAIDGVLLLSSDRHRSEAWRNERAGSYPLYEFLSGKLTNIHTHEPVPGPLFSYNEKNSFGLLHFDTRKSDPEVTFEIVNIDHRVVHSLTVRKSEISDK